MLIVYSKNFDWHFRVLGMTSAICTVVDLKKTVKGFSNSAVVLDNVIVLF